MTFVWIAALAVTAIIAYALGRASRKGGDLVGDQLSGSQLSGGQPAGAGWAASGRAVEDEARRLVARGDKIQAVKIYREATGLGLKEAKEAVERLAAGQPVEPVTPQTTAELGDLATQARALKQRGETIRAIKLVRTATGLGLKEAKDFVDDL